MTKTPTIKFELATTDGDPVGVFEWAETCGFTPHENASEETRERFRLAMPRLVKRSQVIVGGSSDFLTGRTTIKPKSLGDAITETELAYMVRNCTGLRVTAQRLS